MSNSCWKEKKRIKIGPRVKTNLQVDVNMSMRKMREFQAFSSLCLYLDVFKKKFAPLVEEHPIFRWAEQK